jgi:hypothetical protein
MRPWVQIPVPPTKCVCVCKSKGFFSLHEIVIFLLTWKLNLSDESDLWVILPKCVMSNMHIPSCSLDFKKKSKTAHDDSSIFGSGVVLDLWRNFARKKSSYLGSISSGLQFEAIMARLLGKTVVAGHSHWPCMQHAGSKGSEPPPCFSFCQVHTFFKIQVGFKYPKPTLVIDYMVI